jgi:hypothetical protein
MDPQRTHHRFRTQQTSAREINAKQYDIPDTPSSEWIPPLPAGSENFTDRDVYHDPILPILLLLVSGSVYIFYKIYRQKV